MAEASRSRREGCRFESCARYVKDWVQIRIYLPPPDQSGFEEIMEVLRQLGFRDSEISPCDMIRHQDAALVDYAPCQPPRWVLDAAADR